MSCGAQLRGGSRRKMRRGKNKSHRNKSRHNRRASRRHQGGNHFVGAPLSDSLAGGWSAKMSAGQGGDFMKYHAGQHGGNHLMGAPVGHDSMLPAALRGPAHLGGIDAAIAGIQGMSDHKGGRRKKSKKSKKSRKVCKGGRRQRSHRHRSRRHRRNRGGAIGYAPFPSDGMLLKSQTQYAQAGLHPEWKTAVEYDMADARASQ